MRLIVLAVMLALSFLAPVVAEALDTSHTAAINA
jgi:hypothetical protein